MLIRVATDNQGMSEVIGERLLTILGMACTCEFFDVIKDHKLGLFSQDAMVSLVCRMYDYFMLLFLIVKHAYISDIEAS